VKNKVYGASPPRNIKGLNLSYEREVRPDKIGGETANFSDFPEKT
jgi:hypothetical protein